MTGRRGVCSCCTSADANAIDQDLSGGSWTLRDLSRRWGISKSALHAHKKKHMVARLKKAAAERAKGSDPALLDQLEERLQKCLTYCEHAIASANTDRNWPAFVSAVRELRATVVEIGKFRGLIKGSDTTINVFQLDEETAERMARVYLEGRQPPAIPTTVVLAVPVGPGKERSHDGTVTEPPALADEPEEDE